MANPTSRNQFVMTAAAERLMGWHVGQIVPMYFYTSAEENSSSFGTNKVKPVLRLDMHLVGTVVLNDEVVLDEVDRYPAPMIFTPTLTRRLEEPASTTTPTPCSLTGDRGICPRSSARSSPSFQRAPPTTFTSRQRCRVK